MIIDARKATTTNAGRPYTTLAAVFNAVETLAVGSQIDVDDLIDITGASLPRLRLDVSLSKVRGDRKFTVRAMPGIMARVFRVA
jgi:hypothetical protein